MAKKNIQIVYSVTDQALIRAEKTLKANEAAANKADHAVKQYGKDAKKAGDVASTSFYNLKNIIATIGVVQLGRQIIEVTGQFQKFSAVLENTLGSKSAAQKAMRDIRKFAAETPFSVTELTASFVKLANQGFKPATAELRKLGDVAASQGKSFDQLTEAIIDAQTGEFERLKEFGVRAAKEGSNVVFTFKGVQTQVDFTSEAIRNYVLSLGDAVGVTGSMAAISGTLEGRISNLGDAFDNLLLAIGTSSSGPLFNTIEGMTSLVNAMSNLNNELALIGQAVSPFHDLSDVSKETLDYLMKYGRTDSGKNLSDVLGQFTNQEANQFLKSYDENRKKFVETLTKEGEKIDDINVLWARFVELQIQAANESREAQAAQRLLNVMKAKDDAAVAVAKAKAETKAIREGGEAILKAMKDKEAADQQEKDASKTRLDSLRDFTESRVNLQLEGAAREVEITKEKTDAEIKAEEEAAHRKMQLHQMAFDYGVALLGQFLMARVNAEDETFKKEKGNFDKRLKLVGDNEQARQQIESEREEFEAAQDAKAEVHAKEQAKREKERQIKQMIVQGLLNSIRALGNPPVPNFASAGITAAFSAASVGIAKGIGFKEGVIGLEGPGTGTSDSIPARLSKGESVITAEATSHSRSLLEAIQERAIDDRILRKINPNSAQAVAMDVRGIEERLDKILNAQPDHYQKGHLVYEVRKKAETLKRHAKAKNFS